MRRAFPVAWSLLLALTGCPAGAKAPPAQQPAARGAGAAESKAAPTAPALLVEVAAAFERGATAVRLAELVGSRPPARSSPEWLTLAGARFGLELDARAPSPTAPVDWLRVRPGEAHPLVLGQLQEAFGGYRKLPRGEYTWVIFDAVRRPITISASAILSKEESASRAVMVQFQHVPEGQ